MDEFGVDLALGPLRQNLGQLMGQNMRIPDQLTRRNSNRHRLDRPREFDAAAIDDLAACGQRGGGIVTRDPSRLMENPELEQPQSDEKARGHEQQQDDHEALSRPRQRGLALPGDRQRPAGERHRRHRSAIFR